MCLILSRWRHPLKNKMFLLLIVVLVSCTPAVVVTPPEVIDPVAVDPVPVVNVRVYNSAWEIVQEGYVERARAVTTIQSYADYVAEYNAANTEDQYFVVEGEEIIPIEDAPAANIYIAEYTTHDIIRQFLDWPRVDLVERRELWRFQAMADGGDLYVDRVPPPPIPIVDLRPAYEKWALYLIYTIDNTIKYEEHPETEEYYLLQRPMYELQVMADGGLTYMVAGRLYP